MPLEPRWAGGPGRAGADPLYADHLDGEQLGDIGSDYVFVDLFAVLRGMRGRTRSLMTWVRRLW